MQGGASAVFQQGEYVVYADSGLCLVEQVGVPDFSGSDRSKTYYFLRSVEDGSRIYVPTDTHMPLRAPMTAEEAERLLASIADLPVAPPHSRDRKTVQQHYQALMRPHTPEALAQTVKTIRRREAPGRMTSVEEAVLRRAEQQLYGELACALGVSEEDAAGRLRAELTA